MKYVIQNKIGKITLDQNIIRQSIIKMATINSAYKVIDFKMEQKKQQEFIFVLTFTPLLKQNILKDLDVMVSDIVKNIQQKLEIFNPIVIARISNAN
ncbi:MAG: hypothetical protein LBP70_03920 [Mycoplasmataceae bacterium]|jgi:hypothetical protein|nr:hypothetical protein [Mycoplasmataceae bacterium]